MMNILLPILKNFELAFIMQMYQFKFIGSNRNPRGNDGEGRRRKLQPCFILFHSFILLQNSYH